VAKEDSGERDQEVRSNKDLKKEGRSRTIQAKRMPGKSSMKKNHSIRRR